MRFGISIPNFGEYSEPEIVVDLARTAEGAGWDGFFLWDHILAFDGNPVADPWVTLAAVAARTSRVVIGPMVTPLPRRRPWNVARQAVTLDRLSGGRTVLGVGLGFPADEEFATFGEPTDDAVRAEMLDEALAIVVGMWSGEPFGFDGRHYRLATRSFLPTAVQAPRIPIWVAGMWPHHRPFRRAARFEGVFPIRADMDLLDPGQLSEIRAYVRKHRSDASPFDLIVAGPPDPALAARYAEVGATWYLAGPSLEGESAETIRQWVGTGPPKQSQ